MESEQIFESWELSFIHMINLQIGTKRVVKTISTDEKRPFTYNL